MQVSSMSFDRENCCDYFDTIFMSLTCCSSIVTSRKRKLRELFAVATENDGIPNFDFANPNAKPTTPAESQFLLQTDILQYVETIYLFVWNKL